MLCPSCRANNSKVIDSRLTEGGAAIRRRRVCQACERRFTTKERVDTELRFAVIKANGQRVPYDRNKVVIGVDRACYKLDITENQVQVLVDHIEKDLFANHDREVASEEIGRLVGLYLARLNPVAYVRFMSVHRKYSTVEEFVDEIRDVRIRVSHDSPDQQSLFES